LSGLIAKQRTGYFAESYLSLMNTTPRIVITGMGTLNPLSNTVQGTWTHIKNGVSGIDCITRCDTSQLDTKIGGEVKGFDPVHVFGHKEARRMDRYSQLAVAAVLQAWEQSGNVVTADNTFDICVLMSAGFGGAETLSENFHVMLEHSAQKIRPLAFPMMLNNMASAQTAMRLGIRGLNFSISSACATSSNAIGEGAEIIKRGDASIAIVGGSEASIVPMAIGGLNAMRALSTRNDEPTHASRQFDMTRDGYVPSEAAAALVLESLDHAQARGAVILGELVGYGASCDASHVTAPDPEGTAVVYAMRRALRKANLDPSQIDYINAHGTSTRLNDSIETKAIKLAFGDQAYHIPTSSTKSMTGHPMSAAGALEAIISLLAIRDGIMPPTINYKHPDPECDLDYVPNQARPKALRYVMSNSLGFGGHNSLLIFKGWEGEN